MSRVEKGRRWITGVVVAALTLALHIVGAWAVGTWFVLWHLAQFEAPVAVRILPGDPLPGEADPLSAEATPVVPRPEEELLEPEPEEPDDPPLPSGQIVETAPPQEEKIPLQADYLAEHDNAVPEETATRQYRINPDVLAPIWSEDARMELKDLADVGASEASSGARAGGTLDSKPGKGAPRSAIPSQFALTNKEGIASPTVASALRQDLRGAPQNDRLDEKYGAAVALNTREFFGAEYMNRIRRQVNFYWKQNLDNLSPSVRLGKPRYNTVVEVVLNADGVLESIAVKDKSGSIPIDDCVTDAFRIAGPYPNPPAQLIARDNRVYLPDFDFEVTVGQAQMRYQGVDPRAGVQFPGIMNAPR
jgi:outer membrane biosynthesis protein TonB